MNEEQIKRLRELLAKKAADRTEEESTEFKSLLDLSDENGVEIFNSDDALSEAEVKSLISEGVADGFKTLGFEDSKIDELKKALDDKPSVSSDDIQKAIKEVLGGDAFDPDKLANMIEQAAEKAVKEHAGVSKEDVQELFELQIKQMRRTASKHVIPTAPAQPEVPSDFPIEHRAGNLTVGQKQLLNVMTLATPGMKEAQVQEIQNTDIPESLRKQAEERGHKHLVQLRNAARYGGKTLTTTGSNSGAELIPTDLSSDLLNRMYLESAIAGEFVSSEIQMPTDSFELPIRTTRPTFYVGSENPGSNPTESSPGTNKVTLSANKLIGRTNFSYEADEDSIVAVLPMVTENLAAAAADALEGAIINGDTTATHQDSDIHAVTNHHAKLFKGLRKYAIAGSCSTSLATGGISAANILTIKKNMGRWGIKPRDVMIVCGVNAYNDLLGLSETITADKVGSNMARILTGEAPQLYGMPVIVSSQVREDLNASGVYDGTTTTKGSILLVNRPSWIMGVRRGFTVEIDRDIQQQVNIVVASFRRDLQPLETPSTSLPYTWLGYNYDA